jgi:putative membrane protein
MRIIRLAIMLMLCPLPALAQTAADDAVPTIPADQKAPVPAFSPYAFLATAAAANAFEIEAAKLAQAKAGDAEVKAFAAQMLADHEKAQAEMFAAAKADKVEIAEPSMDGEQDGMIGKLEAASGAAFDQLYVGTQLAAHERAVALFQGYQGSDTELRRFANATLPVLVAHHDRVAALAERLKVPMAKP